MRAEAFYGDLEAGLGEEDTARLMARIDFPAEILSVFLFQWYCVGLGTEGACDWSLVKRQLWQLITKSVHFATKVDKFECCQHALKALRGFLKWLLI